MAGPEHRVWYSGDTGYHSEFPKIGERLGPFDVTLIEVGQYGKYWPDYHLGPEQAAEVDREVHGKVMIPVHWGLLQLVALRQNLSGPGRALPRGLGAGSAGLVCGTDLQTGQADRLESAEANDAALLGVETNETDLRIELTSGGTICLRGADNYDSMRGDGLDFLILDEYASIHQHAWTEVLRPSLADKQGRALFTGTPRGYNHFFDRYRDVQGRPEWSTFQFTTEQGGNACKAESASS